MAAAKDFKSRIHDVPEKTLIGVLRKKPRYFTNIDPYTVKIYSFEAKQAKAKELQAKNKADKDTKKKAGGTAKAPAAETKRELSALEKRELKEKEEAAAKLPKDVPQQP